MEEIKMVIPTVGTVSVIPLQDLPVDHVTMWKVAPEEMRSLIGWKLFGLAAGAGVDLDLLSYSEAEEVVEDWKRQSMLLGELRASEKENGLDESIPRTELDFWRLLE
ncbi:hypothetical protein QEH42_gp184 [Microbacterium phage Pumpernickel]|uniref:Uncharacterized protein n=1 Tax=Microbacterium phage Pumpernickel TaxID=2885983 RepID=A0AAE8YBR6_9CAUD|nr:hypothetical protein QEH42_gp184 [Microbacterium phage Pumpernickel]UDL16034.1 hypothetical protein SEA_PUMPERNICKEL_284 [Microbacterium phage Pumpernickel]